jgi:hypothetical protein
MNLPNITYKQQAIVELIYTYRFLNRTQIQGFMGHTDKRRISAWLQDLRAKHYVEWIYDGHDFAKKTQPAIYYIGINGIRYLKKVNVMAEQDIYPTDELHKRYRESGRSQSYIDRCQLIADACIALDKARTDDTWYFYEAEAEYRRDSFFHFLTDSELIAPYLCFSKEFYDGGTSEPITLDTYFLEVFDPNYPRYRMRKCLKNYVQFFSEDEWEYESEDEPSPSILFVCATTSDLIYAKRSARGFLAREWEREDDDRPSMLFTTTQTLKQKGVLGEEAWEEA